MTTQVDEILKYGDSDDGVVRTWHPSHRVSTMQDLGGDIYTQCTECKARELTLDAEMPCTALSVTITTETHFGTGGAGDR